MSFLQTWCMFIPAIGILLAGPAGTEPPAPRPGNGAPPPLELEFLQSSGLPEGWRQAYDPATGVFHVHFQPPKRIGKFSGLYKRSAFRVAKVNGPFLKPVVFRLTGVPEGYGCLGDPLALSTSAGESLDYLRMDGKSYPLVADPLALEPVDQTLFQVERKGGIVTVIFTKRGQELLRPGALISFKMDYGW